MAIMSKEYYADIESVYKKPEDYELAGKGNAYIRIDAEAKSPAPRFTPMTCICPACTTASSSTPPTRMRLLRASTFPRH